MRGSPASTTPSLRSCSASTVIVRSLRISKRRSPRPSRIWRNSTGPPSSSLIAQAASARIGAASASAGRAADDVDRALDALGLGVHRVPSARSQTAGTPRTTSPSASSVASVTSR